ncbi:hypothetical protein U1Q18_036430 [Sarracenia purpurea var. burkii]
MKKFMLKNLRIQVLSHFRDQDDGFQGFRTGNFHCSFKLQYTFVSGKLAAASEVKRASMSLALAIAALLVLASVALGWHCGLGQRVAAGWKHQARVMGLVVVLLQVLV